MHNGGYHISVTLPEIQADTHMPTLCKIAQSCIICDASVARATLAGATRPSGVGELRTRYCVQTSRSSG